MKDIDKNKYFATREEYINFCVEFLGLFSLIMSEIGQNVPFGVNFVQYNRLEEVFYEWESGQALLGFAESFANYKSLRPYYNSTNTYQTLEVKSLVESLRVPFIEAYEAKQHFAPPILDLSSEKFDLDRFHNAPAVLNFKKQIFEGFSDKIAFSTADFWINKFDSLLCFRCEEFKGFNLYNLYTAPYVLKLHQKSLDFQQSINISHLHSGNVDEFRTTPSKYKQFIKDISHVLTREENEEFTRKDKYKWLFHFLDTLFGESDEDRIRWFLYLIIPFTPSAARDAFDKDGGGLYRSGNTEFERIFGPTVLDDEEDSEFRIIFGPAVLADDDEEEQEFWLVVKRGLQGWDKQDLYIRYEWENYTKENIYLNTYNSLAHTAFMEYCDEGRTCKYSGLLSLSTCYNVYLVIVEWIYNLIYIFSIY